MKYKALFFKAWAEMYLSHLSQCGGEACRIIGTFQREGCLVQNIKKITFRSAWFAGFIFAQQHSWPSENTAGSPHCRTAHPPVNIMPALIIINQYHALMEINYLKQGCYIVKYCKHLRTCSLAFLCFFAPLCQLHSFACSALFCARIFCVMPN